MCVGEVKKEKEEEKEKDEQNSRSKFAISCARKLYSDAVIFPANSRYKSCYGKKMTYKRRTKRKSRRKTSVTWKERNYAAEMKKSRKK